MSVDILVRMSVVRLVDMLVRTLVSTSVAVTVRVTVRTGMLPPSPSSPPVRLLSLCCAPANRPMKTELKRRRINARMHKNLLRGVRGSCTRDEIRSPNVGACCSGGVASGCETSCRRGAASDNG